jgi:hypothetical protein
LPGGSEIETSPIVRVVVEVVDEDGAIGEVQAGVE